MSLYLETFQGPHQGLINWGKAATALQADQGPYEPIAWESQSEPDWVRVSSNVWEWARERQSELERARVSRIGPEGEPEWVRESKI